MRKPIMKINGMKDNKGVYSDKNVVVKGLRWRPCASVVVKAEFVLYDDKKSRSITRFCTTTTNESGEFVACFSTGIRPITATKYSVTLKAGYHDGPDIPSIFDAKRKVEFVFTQ